MTSENLATFFDIVMTLFFTVCAIWKAENHAGANRRYFLQFQPIKCLLFLRRKICTIKNPRTCSKSAVATLEQGYLESTRRQLNIEHTS